MSFFASIKSLSSNATFNSLLDAADGACAAVADKAREFDAEAPPGVDR